MPQTIFLADSPHIKNKGVVMRLLTDGKIMVMIFDNKPETAPIPLFPEHVDNEMDWAEQNPSIVSISQIKKRWPYLFDSKNMLYISNLKFVEVNIKLYELDCMDYLAGARATRPHFMDSSYLKIL